MNELQRHASTCASFLDLLYKRRTNRSGELCIQTDESPYHWPGAATWCLISGLFAKATQEFSAAQRIVASWLTVTLRRRGVSLWTIWENNFTLDCIHPAEALLLLVTSSHTSSFTAGTDIQVKNTCGVDAPGRRM
jgi:hypothetical protein